MPNLIYIADDDAVNLRMVQAFLEKEGFLVECFENGDLLYETFLQKQCDLVILDVLMPGSDGFTIGAKIRQISGLPIIVLTGKESDNDYIFGISLGLDVYLTKPYNPAKLIAHVRTLLIKAELEKSSSVAKTPAVITYADLAVDPTKLTAYCGGDKLLLTNNEFNLLKFFLENHEKAISRDELLIKVWGFNSIVETRAVDDTIKRLRRKLSEAKSLVSIEAVRGFGFRVRKDGINS